MIKKITLLSLLILMFVAQSWAAHAPAGAGCGAVLLLDNDRGPFGTQEAAFIAAGARGFRIAALNGFKHIDQTTVEIIRNKEGRRIMQAKLLFSANSFEFRWPKRKPEIKDTLHGLSYKRSYDMETRKLLPATDTISAIVGIEDWSFLNLAAERALGLRR